ncbi:MAG: FadR family transcriptional regulator [Desulfomonile tiedjei]|nr:FadR family transcriptional regulator [Desulfomonile tiedjei]
MGRFKPIRQPRVSEEVIEQLKQAFIVGHFKEGDRLPPERELAKEFQVSRVAIREALRALEGSGFVTVKQGVSGGAYVTDLTFETLSNAFVDLFMAEKISVPELVYVRRVIEPEIARMASAKVSPDYRKRLLEAIKAEELPVKSLLQDFEAKTMVHFILAEMCGNRLLEALVKSLMGMTTRFVASVRPDVKSMHPAGMHRPIVEAVLGGKGDAAAESMRRHTEEFGVILIGMEEEFRQRPFPVVI